MAYVESSVGKSALASFVDDESEDGCLIGDDVDGDKDEEELEPRDPKKKPPAGSLKAALIDAIDDINLARYIPDDELDRIGMDCVREYEIDENSRAGWVDRAVTAMKFATQESQPKEFPWPGASNVIFPMIAQSAIDFAARTYPAIIQNKKVVKGIIWGSDKGTPVTTDGKADGPPKMEPIPPPQGAAAPMASAGTPPQPDPNAPPAQQSAPGMGMQPVWLIAPGEKRKRADRIAEHMSWQLLDEMPEWEPQTDQLLHEIPVAGGKLRKTYFDPLLGRNRSLAVSIMNVVWNYHAPSFEDAPRHTEKILLYPNQIEEMERFEQTDDSDGMFLPLPYGTGGGTDGRRFGYDEEAEASDASDPDAPHFFIEQHRRLDLDKDGYAEPYIVTVHLRSGKPVRIVARYDEDGIHASEDGDTINRIEAIDHYTLYPFLPSLDGGSYPMGFGHLLKPLTSAINTTLNQMFDAGTLANSGGGFISDQLGLPSGQTLFQVGKYTRVNSKGSSIRDAVFPIPFPGPSTVLFQLLGLLISSGKELASIGNVLAGDAAIANAPPTTILALIEQGMKVYTAIHKRIYRAEKSELAKLFRLNRKNLKDTQRYQIGDEFREITPEDYRLGGGVEPIADPTMTTDMQKLGRAQILMQFDKDPLINQKEIRMRLFEAANLDRIEDLFNPPDPTQTMIQMAMAQAELGKLRSEEQKNNTQAFLNLALARKNASAAEESQLAAQMDYFRLRIEAVNAQTRADAVDHAYHSTNMQVLTDHARMGMEAAGDAADRAAAAGTTPGPSGGFPQATATPLPGDAVNRPAPGGLPSDISDPGAGQ